MSIELEVSHHRVVGLDLTCKGRSHTISKVSDNPERKLQVALLLPIYNDWESAKLLVHQLDSAVPTDRFEYQLLIVDDGSASPIKQEFLQKAPANITKIEVLRLRRNLGHQRAIAIGLTFIQQQRPCDAALVMDADGEDRPEDVPRLLQRLDETNLRKIIFAERTKRSEPLAFRIFYQVYRLLHRMMTGVGVKSGNFSVVPSEHLSSLVVVSELWNHYPAAVLKAGLPFESVPTVRGQRLSGKSSMNFVNLVTHGLSAVSVFAETAGVRMMGFCLASIALLVCLLFAVVGVRVFTGLAIPGWATYTGGLLLIILFQFLTVTGGLILFILNARNNLSFIPIRDYHFFIDSVKEVPLSDG